MWVRMRFGYWTSRDRLQWTRVAQCASRARSSRARTRARRSGRRCPCGTIGGNRWNLFYVAYHSAPRRRHEIHAESPRPHLARACRALPGLDGIAGPLRRRAGGDGAGARLAALGGPAGHRLLLPVPRRRRRGTRCYGSAKSETLPITHWLVGLASAPALGGPWTRVRAAQPRPDRAEVHREPDRHTGARTAAGSRSTTASRPGRSAGRTPPTGSRGARATRSRFSPLPARGRRTSARRSASSTRAAGDTPSSTPGSSRIPTGCGCCAVKGKETCAIGFVELRLERRAGE